MIKEREPDYTLFFVTMVILGFGLIMVYSSSSVFSLMWYKDSAYFLKRQLLGAILGLGTLFIATSYHYEKYRKHSSKFLILSIILLILVLVPGIGKVVGGSRRWIRLGFLSFQPSEFARLVLVFYIADYMDREGKDIKNFVSGLLPLLMVIGSVFFLILLEPDMGTALSAGIISGIIILVGGASILHLFLLTVVSIPILAWFIFSEKYRLDRILTFLNPWKEPLGRGFHIIQALIALGSGGIFGLGLGASRQKFFYVPGAHTDFIFSIIGEELGFLGVVFLFLMFFILIIKGIKISMSIKDKYGSLLAFGIISKIAIDFFINVGVNVKVFPVTGLNLPLVSYGGTSLLFTLFSIGVLLNISRYKELRRQ